ncbi:hypothetical protein VVD49_11370 [Uliginosibacterium sp. H3]|uniref:AsmA-like C-terminal domain-containing protein n=1 Tax=Uliginosibacterium silvisoli TaxID=3114758 RepID=A0ABU6K5P7_9RHOO|nr:hypothetical protein [Uliginosibacterium sp. H3]
MKKIPKSMSYGSALLTAAALVFANFLWSGVAQGGSPETWLGLPVTYVEDGYTFHPWPAQALKDMKIHTPDPILVAKAWVTPDWNAWITSGKTNRVRIEADEIVARPSSLLRLGSFDGKSTHKITGVRFAKLKLLMGATAIALPSGEMDFAEDGTLTHLRIATEQGMRFDVTPHGDKLTILAQLTNWKWDVLPALRFESVVAQGEINDDRILFDKIGGTGDGGSVEGLVRLTVTDAFAVDGELKLDKLNSVEVLKRIYAGHTVQGLLMANVKIAASAPSLSDLSKNMTASGTYSLRSGSVDRFGLLEGLRRQESGPAGGGLTKFVSLDGTFAGGVGKPSSVTMRRIDGGAMQGSGSFQVSLENKLRGNVTASIKLPNGDTKTRALVLTGAVNAPTLMVP